MTSEAWSVGCARVARALRNGALDLDLVGEALDADALGIRRSSSSTPRVSIATAHTRLRAVTAATRTPGAGCHCPPTYRQQPVQSTAMKCLSRGCFQEFSCRGSQPPATRFRWCPAESRWPSAPHPPGCSLCAEHPSTSHTSIPKDSHKNKIRTHEMRKLPALQSSILRTPSRSIRQSKGSSSEGRNQGCFEPHRTLGPTCQTDSPAGVVNR